VRLQWNFPECGEKTAVVIHVERGVKAVVVEELTSMKNGKWKMVNEHWSHSTEILLDEEAEVEFISVNMSSAPVHLTQRSELQANAKISWKNGTLGSGKTEHDLVSTLHGADAVSDIDWMFYAKDSENYQLRARNTFLGRHGGGEIIMKGVAEESGHVKCNGMIEIGEHGGQTDTYLTQDVLMLDATAKVDAVPALEIKTNDVKASHSAAVSRVTAEDLFYFGSRGIQEREARRMFVEGFLGDLIQKITFSDVRESMFARVQAKYGVKP
jgi:Fe-S cluster assembly protein SufB/Fe-S cluster assembly protein SufD